MEKVKNKKLPVAIIGICIGVFIVAGLFKSKQTHSVEKLAQLSNSYPIIATDVKTIGEPYNQIPGLPCTMFIGKDGKIKAMIMGAIKTSLKESIINSSDSPAQALIPKQLINTQWYGKDAPNFLATDINGKEHELSKFKGKEVMITFWATWCVYCREEIPELIEMRSNISESELVMLSISYEKEDTIKRFVGKTRKTE